MIRVARVLQHTRLLKAVARSAAGTWTERTGLTLLLEDDAGLAGVGEAAPLPGFSPDELAGAKAALVALLGRTFPDAAPGDVVRALSDAAQSLPSPSARFALESALLDLWARQLRIPAWALLSSSDGFDVPELSLSLWLPHARDAAVAEAHRALARGVRAFKVKLDGRDASDPGLSILEALREKLGRDVELRADANQSLSAEQAHALGPRLAVLGVRWVEEPTTGAPHAELGLPVALDESLTGARPDFAEARAAGVKALVLKPSVLGGLSPCLDLASAAAPHGITSVVSHALEGPVAAMAQAAFALALGPGRPADGLSPHPGLGGERPPCFEPGADRLIAWRTAGLALSLGQALAGATGVEEARA